MWKVLKDDNTNQTALPVSRETAMGSRSNRTLCGTTDWLKIGKRLSQGYISFPCLYAEYITWNAGLDESQAGIKIARRNINNFRYTDDTILMAKSEEELTSLLKVKEDSEKAGLKLNIQKTKIMTSGPITSWQIDGGKSVNRGRFYFLGLKNYRRQWLQPQNWKMLAPWKESYDKSRQCIKKQRHHFADKSPHSQSYGFSSSHIWMWRMDPKEGWALKNCCFQIVVLVKTLQSPLDSKEIKPANPKGNQPRIFIAGI